MVSLSSLAKGKIRVKILLFGKNSKSLSPILNDFGFEETTTSPDLVISYGGDGTLLASERTYPEIPKLPIRDSNVCKKCSNHTEETLLNLLKENQLKLEKIHKLAAESQGRKLLALNDIVVRNTTPIHALRFNLKINEKNVSPVVIVGDGLVISTAFGSTGYYKSITKKSFEKGYSIAFSNTTKDLHPVNFKRGDLIEIKIIRGPAAVSADNNPKFITLEENDIVEIQVSNQKALIYRPEILRCNNCIIKREKRLDH